MNDQGLAQRTFCFISDSIEMLLNILLNGKTLVYNVSGEKFVTIKGLADNIAQINQASVVIPKITTQIMGTPQRSTIDNYRYCHEFNKKKFITLKEGLKITSLWFNNLKPQ